MDPQTIAIITTVGTLVITICGGVCITIAAIAPVVLIFWWMFRRQKEIGQRSAQAMPAQATILSAQSFSSEYNSRLNVELVLDVQPPFGANYQTKVYWDIDYLAANQAQPGQKIAVKIDAQDKNVIYPAVPWAVYSRQKVIRLGG